MNSHYYDTGIHQIIEFSFPDGQTGQLLKLLANYTEGSDTGATKLFIKEHLKLLTQNIKEVQYSNRPTASHFPFEMMWLRAKSITRMSFVGLVEI